MRLLHRLEDERHVVECVVLAAEADASRAQRLHHDLVGLEVHRLRLRRIDAERGDLERGHAAADAELEPPSAQVVESADLLGEAQGVVERQRIDEGAEAQAPGALRREREENLRRWRHPERRTLAPRYWENVEAEPDLGFCRYNAVSDILTRD